MEPEGTGYQSADRRCDTRLKKTRCGTEYQVEEPNRSRSNLGETDYRGGGIRRREWSTNNRERSERLRRRIWSLLPRAKVKARAQSQVDQLPRAKREAGKESLI